MTTRAKKTPILEAIAPLLDERVPPCSSWLGHRFEGRWDDFGGLSDLFWLHSVALRGLSPTALNAYQKRRVYVRDVCVRCGHVIARSNG